jgi:hypothetical protein
MDSTSVATGFRDVGFSPDGRTVVIGITDTDGGQRYYWRSLDSLERLPLPVSVARLGNVVFSPDGRELSIVDRQGWLRTMPVGGEPGPALVKNNVAGPLVWTDSGNVYYWAFANAGEPERAWRVVAAGGEPEKVDVNPPSDFLPGGRILLATRYQREPDSLGTVIAVDVATGESRDLATGGLPMYIDPGYLAFCRDAALWAAPIDASTGELVAPARAIEQVEVTEGPMHYCRFSLSRSGNLAYVRRRETGQSRLVWVTLDGAVEPVAPEVKNFFVPTVSLDGRQVSAQVTTSQGFEQWILDLSTGSWSRPAQSGSMTSAARWVPPEGREVIFQSDRVDGIAQSFIQAADRSSPPKPLWPGGRANVSLDVSADGRLVILVAFDTPGFFVLDRVSGDLRSVVQEGTVYAAMFHRDGDWILYARQDAGDSNIWVAPFPGPGEPRQITFDGGEEPQWSRKGDAIVYRGPTHFISIPVEKSGGALVTGRPRPLFEDRFRHHQTRGFRNYSQHPDGRLLIVEDAEKGEESLVLVENWSAKVVQAFARDGG